MNTILQQIADNYTDFFDYALGNILDKESNIEFSEIMKDFQDFQNAMGVVFIEHLLKTLDEKIYEDVRKQRTYHIKEKSRERTVIIPQGAVTYHRRYYKHKETGEHVHLLDQLIGWNPSQRIDPYCASTIVEHALSMSYAKAASIGSSAAISRQTVKNLVHKLPTPPNTLQQEITAVSSERIYIEVDEDHVSLQDGRNIQMKLATIYTDKIAVGKNRTELQNKHSFTGLESPDEFWSQIDAYIARAFKGLPKVYIIGDGAAWIKKGLECIPNSQFVLDKFHLLKYIRKICGNYSPNKALRYLINDEQEKFIALVSQFKEKHPERILAITSGETYVLNQWEYARRALLESNIHSSTEGHVSHILSARLSSRPLGWSTRGAETIAKLRVLHDNRESVKAFVLESYNSRNTDIWGPLMSQSIVSAAKAHKTKKRKTIPYNNYLADQAASIPGSEAGSNAWLRKIKKGGFGHF